MASGARGLYAANRKTIGKNPNLIKPGQRLKMPDGSTHVVKRGENLTRIANSGKKGKMLKRGAPATGAPAPGKPDIRVDPRERAGFPRPGKPSRGSLPGISGPIPAVRPKKGDTSYSGPGAPRKKPVQGGGRIGQIPGLDGKPPGGRVPLPGGKPVDPGFNIIGPGRRTSPNPSPPLGRRPGTRVTPLPTLRTNEPQPVRGRTRPVQEDITKPGFGKPTPPRGGLARGAPDVGGGRPRPDSPRPVIGGKIGAISGTLKERPLRGKGTGGAAPPPTVVTPGARARTLPVRQPAPPLGARANAKTVRAKFPKRPR